MISPEQALAKAIETAGKLIAATDPIPFPPPPSQQAALWAEIIELRMENIRLREALERRAAGETLEEQPAKEEGR